MLFVSLVLMSLVVGNSFSSDWWMPGVENVVSLDVFDRFLCPCSDASVDISGMQEGPAHGTVVVDTPRVCSIDQSLERHRYQCAYFREFGLMNYLQGLSNETSSSGAIRVLHNSPEQSIAIGLNLANNKNIDYVGFDYFVGPLVYKSKFNEFQFDLSELPFPNNYFHFFVTNHVLEHVSNVSRCLSELYRTLKPGGIGFISVPMGGAPVTEEERPMDPHTEEFREVAFGQKDHLRRFGADFEDWILRHGFLFDEATDRQPAQFYQRPHLFPHISIYQNIEYTAAYAERGIYFVYKPGGKIPPHLLLDLQNV